MRRTRLGLGAAAGTAALALLVTGCGSGDAGGGENGGQGGDGGASSSGGADTGGKDDGGPDDGGTSQGEASGGGADTGGTGGGGGPGGSDGPGGADGGSGGTQSPAAPYQGPWAAGVKSGSGSPMILIFNDTEASLAGPELACQGSLKAAKKPAKLELKCQDGSDDYTSGTVTELNEKTLTVKWSSGEERKFLKGAAPAGPSGE